ncbi:hypothetical protein L905_19270 [Agrobacterium sp. TS43]|uniref:hypothetical protein n=1 Tax=Agrobacterium TaxID=357 RepID=UPI00049FD2B0|nr:MULTISPECIES: hypothetical protein [Agrobacterium]KDR88280.1 hypothetical protein K538_12765 [Agrobacterium tumefaciens GW4]KVK49533.1 hypothetical protein L903_19630 [Agrobacterium sp. JL28]KVK49770.1 hypothetical protein L904_19620 [Agrobacterium sp. LY4]KVK62711.1 hypothetical protein L906_18745 [Agrobacterium sp. TS45]KVK65096.1 hypothetical protein L905_19270 [Agrobacterium sp. TS43]
MEYGFTLHSIRRKDEELPVGKVEKFTNADYKDMVRLGAIREPTADEMKLYKLANPDEEVDLENDETGSGADETKATGKGKSTTAKTPAKPKSDAGGNDGDSGALV